MRRGHGCPVAGGNGWQPPRSRPQLRSSALLVVPQGTPVREGQRALGDFEEKSARSSPADLKEGGAAGDCPRGSWKRTMAKQGRRARRWAAKLHHYKLTTNPCSPCPCGFWGEGREVEGVGNEGVKSPAASQGQLAIVRLPILLQIKKNLRSIESKRLAFSLSSAKINTGKAHCLHRYVTQNNLTSPLFCGMSNLDVHFTYCPKTLLLFQQQCFRGALLLSQKHIFRLDKKAIR